MNVKPKFVGIAGGTGAGKSTVCMALHEKYPDTIGVIQLDDYFKPDPEKPQMGGVVNADHPDALYWDRLIHALGELAAGRSVMVNTKNLRLNPDYAKTKQRISVQCDPKPIMLIEGFLILHDEHVRKFLNTTIWLDVPHDVRWERRVHFKNDEYEQKVLKPMHEQYAEPSKRYAEHIIDVTKLTKEKTQKQVEDIIFSL